MFNRWLDFFVAFFYFFFFSPLSFGSLPCRSRIAIAFLPLGSGRFDWLLFGRGAVRPAEGASFAARGQPLGDAGLAKNMNAPWECYHGGLFLEIRHAYGAYFWQHVSLALALLPSRCRAWCF